MRTYPGRRAALVRPYAGSGTAKESNAGYRRLIAQGCTSLSVAFDRPTRLGRDSDTPLARGEVGRAGVAVDSLDDMRVLMDGIPLDRIATSMTIDAPAALLLLLYQLVAEERGIPADRLVGTVRNDVLGAYLTHGACVFPLRPALRLAADVFAYCKDELPRWNALSISRRHLAETGASAAQQIAFALASGVEYVRTAVAAGLDEDDIAAVRRQLAGLRAAPPNRDVEAAALALLQRIEDLGGAVAAIEHGFPQREIERHTRLVAGVRAPRTEDAGEWTDPAVEARQAERIAKLRAWRDQERVDLHMAALRKAASGPGNVLHPMKEALAAGATVGETCAALRETWDTCAPPDPDPAPIPTNGPGQGRRTRVVHE
ncbi:methylmalonyl-CoA mutase family protein [Streptomyces yokosukanensis]|uniref:methylmalonyl-CoA mutase family protein n=1 Tax=Streptomyces yokosukanensis TaxID=67386 RepID=UPI003CC549B0